MISFNGRLGRKQYFIKLITIYAIYFAAVIAFLITVALTSTKTAEGTATNNTVFIAGGIVFVLLSLYLTIYVIGLTLRRGRDAGNAVLFALLALFVPLFIIILGFLPRQADKT